MNKSNRDARFGTTFPQGFCEILHAQRHLIAAVFCFSCTIQCGKPVSLGREQFQKRTDCQKEKPILGRSILNGVSKSEWFWCVCCTLENENKEGLSWQESSFPPPVFLFKGTVKVTLYWIIHWGHLVQCWLTASCSLEQAVPKLGSQSECFTEQSYASRTPNSQIFKEIYTKVFRVAASVCIYK